MKTKSGSMSAMTVPAGGLAVGLVSLLGSGRVVLIVDGEWWTRGGEV